MKKTFKHKKLWLRVLGFLPILCIVFCIQIVIIHKSPVSDSAVYMLDGGIICLFIYIYYKLTEKYNWYIQNGEYWVDNDKLLFRIRKGTSKIKFDEINEIFMTKNSYIGLRHVVLEIKYGKKKIKLISIPISKETEPYETQFMDIFRIIRANSKQLKAVKNVSGNEVDYWLKTS